VGTLRDSFTSAPDNQGSAGGANTKKAQTFTPAQNYTIASVKLFLYRSSVTGTITVTITTTSGGLPTTTILATATNDGTGITTDTNGAWYEFTFAVPADLTASTNYAIVLEAVNTNSVWWKYLATGTYAGGHADYYNGTWNDYSPRDFNFETYDNVDAFDEGTINVDVTGSVALTVEAQTDKNAAASTTTGNSYGHSLYMGI
jgi:hypothetical protein